MRFPEAALLVLALDTTTRAGSAAVVENGRTLSELAGDPALTHGERLPADLRRVLSEAGKTVAHVDLLAVAAGPGSFTGLRVGIAAIQGLAFATGRRIVPVSTLDALARAGADGTSPIAAWMDAQRGQVFAALYAEDAVTVLQPPSSMPPVDTLDAWHRSGITTVPRFAGDGAIRYAEVIRRLVKGSVVLPSVPPLASIIARMAAERSDHAVLPHAVVPIYIRRPDAEIARDELPGKR